MSAIANVVYDQPAYAPGQTMTVTVTGEWFEQVIGTASIPEGNFDVPPVKVIEPVTYTDQAGRTWALVSNDGSSAVFTATA